MSVRRVIPAITLGLLWASCASAQAPANTTCPVMVGEAVKPEIYSDYSGRRVYFCCRKCKEKFDAAPQRYAKNLDPAEPTPPASGGASPVATEGAAADDLLALLYALDAEEQMKLRRSIRAAQMPDPPPLPPAHGAAFNEIDRFVFAAWAKAGLPQATQPPPICDDATFCRRVYLDLIGVVPTMEEAAQFAADDRGDKRSRLVDELLARDADYADHWTPFWEDALASSPVNLRGGVPTRGNYQRWINDSFRANRPYDVWVAELLDPAMPGHPAPVIADANGKKSRVQFVLNETHTETLQTAAAVGQVFLGTAMKCASCHSHFENTEWPQARFVAFAGMFAAHDLELIRCEARSGQFVPAAFVFDVPGTPRDVPRTEEGRLRRAAQLLTDALNPRFAPAIVNRLWKRYTGLGIFEPADDYRLERTPANPSLLEWLAHDLVRSGFDLKHTIRLILNSRTYQLAYDAAVEDRFDLAMPTAPRYFRSPSLRRMTAEQLLDSMQVVLSQRLDRSSRQFRQASPSPLARQFGRPAARNEVCTGRSEDVAVVQGLELLNGDEFAAMVRGGRLGRQAAQCSTAADAARVLVRAALSREPTADETAAIVAHIGEATPSGTSPHESTWIDDALPDGATPTGEWTWQHAVGDVRPASGDRFHVESAEHGKSVQHYYLTRAVQPVAADDVLFAYVRLDPQNPPAQIMLQWHDAAGWEHRAYWGEDRIPYGMNGTTSRRRMGDLPPAGEWVRLEASAAEVGLGVGAGASVRGMSFDQSGGVVYWDRAGVVAIPPTPRMDAIADALWALFCLPEFQYIH